MSNRNKLEGSVINNLHVDKYIGDSKYQCTCLLCNNTRICRSYELKLGKYKSCKECENTPGVAGSIEGYWKFKHKSSDGYPYWICECTLCNREFRVNIKNVRNGKSKCCVECASKLRVTDISKKEFKLGKIIGYIDSGNWECECGICGERITRSITKLKNQDEIICTHCSGIKLQKDLTGGTFGNWQVIKRVEDSTGYHSRWLCKCLLCGKESKVFTYNLLSGNSKSCGCKSLIDLTDRQINEFHVDRYLGDSKWECTCSCGNKRVIPSFELRSGAAKSCGCKKWEHTKNTILKRYKEIAPVKINSPRDTEQLDAINSKEQLIKFIQDFGYTPTTYELSTKLGLQVSSTLKIIHKFGLDNLVDIGSQNSRQFTDVLNYIYKFVDKAEVIINDRKVLNGKELDIYIPSKNLAIEINGVYWHSTKDKIKELLRNKLHQPDRVIYARKCKVSEIENLEYTEFLNRYHLQNSANAQIKIGCFSNEELVGVMSFGAPRFNNNYEYELIRLCWKNSTAVVGGTQKLFKYFVKKYKPKSIITYSDLSKFIGSSYLALGFKQIADKSFSEPNYVWVKCINNNYGFEVLTRYQTQKHKLLSMGLGTDDSTENEIMDTLGYLKIYDCGNIRFEWKLGD